MRHRRDCCRSYTNLRQTHRRKCVNFGLRSVVLRIYVCSLGRLLSPRPRRRAALFILLQIPKRNRQSPTTCPPADRSAEKRNAEEPLASLIPGAAKPPPHTRDPRIRNPAHFHPHPKTEQPGSMPYLWLISVLESIPKPDRVRYFPQLRRKLEIAALTFFPPVFLPCPSGPGRTSS